MDAVKILSNARRDLEYNKISIGEYEEIIEPFRDVALREDVDKLKNMIKVLQFALDNLPKIVMCYECKHYNHKVMYCCKYLRYTKDEDYCSKGEEGEEGEERR